MNKKLADTAKNTTLVIAIIFVFCCLVVLTSQFAVKHGLITVESTSTQYADIVCIEVLKPRPVSTLVAQK